MYLYLYPYLHIHLCYICIYICICILIYNLYRYVYIYICIFICIYLFGSTQGSRRDPCEILGRRTCRPRSLPSRRVHQNLQKHTSHQSLATSRAPLKGICGHISRNIFPFADPMSTLDMALLSIILAVAHVVFRTYNLRLCTYIYICGNIYIYICLSGPLTRESLRASSVWSSAPRSTEMTTRATSTRRTAEQLL